jgi:hypothetical protein
VSVVVVLVVANLILYGLVAVFIPKKRKRR